MKSMFGNASTTQSNRSIINPVGNHSSSTLFMEMDHRHHLKHRQTFSDIEKKYTSLLAENKFDSMQPDIIEYSILYDKISKLVLSTTTKDTMVQLLFKITLQGLMGSIHAFHLNAANIELQVKTLHLQDRIQTILSDKNTYAIMNTNNQHSNNNRMSLVKTVALAPVYSYYILLFGIPENGFDPVRIRQLVQVLQQYNIDPLI